MKIAIVGSRDYPNMEKVIEYVKGLDKDTVVVSGGARGVDTTAVLAAKNFGLKFEEYPADWGKYGLRAGYIRNTTIVEESDKVVAFWDGHSKGTKDTIDKAKEVGKLVAVFGIDG